MPGKAVDAAIADRCGGADPIRLTLRDGSTLDVACPALWSEDRRRLSLSWGAAAGAIGADGVNLFRPSS